MVNHHLQEITVKGMHLKLCYFAYHNTLPQQKLYLLIWYQDLEESGFLTNQNIYVFLKALLLRFGTSSYDDPMEALKRLRQTDSVEMYITKFEALSNR